ncbi:hypothetical protein Hanom_Chr07g00644541 [Helianthus anomalus]
MLLGLYISPSPNTADFHLKNNKLVPTPKTTSNVCVSTYTLQSIPQKRTNIPTFMSGNLYN